jgi:hypothetical protein
MVNQLRGDFMQKLVEDKEKDVSKLSNEQFSILMQFYSG